LFRPLINRLDGRQGYASKEAESPQAFANSRKNGRNQPKTSTKRPIQEQRSPGKNKKRHSIPIEPGEKPAWLRLRATPERKAVALRAAFALSYCTQLLNVWFRRFHFHVIPFPHNHLNVIITSEKIIFLNEKKLDFFVDIVFHQYLEKDSNLEL
jgi:hypothetical protein